MLVKFKLNSVKSIILEFQGKMQEFYISGKDYLFMNKERHTCNKFKEEIRKKLKTN